MLAACCILALGLIAARAAWVQVIEAPHLSVLAVGQQRATIPLPAERGSLLDRKGQPLALSRPAVTVGATLKYVRNPAAYAAVLAPLLHVDQTTLIKRLADRSHGFVYLARQLDPSVKRLIANAIRLNHLNAGAISFVPESKRVYPQGLALQLLGATDPDGNGIAGAEQSLNSLLHGQAGERVVQHDPNGQVVRVEQERPAVAGDNVTLTVDQDIQSSAEQIASQTLTTWKAKAVTIVALDPRNGGILAMASAPGVPSGGYSKATPDEQRLRAVADGYEPGSTFKVVTIGAALQQGVVTPQLGLHGAVQHVAVRPDDRGRELARHRAADGLADPRRVVERRHGDDRAAAARPDRAEPLDPQAGLRHRPPGVDLPGEFSGEVLPLSKWSGTSILSFPIGEGVLVTPLQMASLYAAIADGGVWHEPHVVAGVDGTTRRTPKGRRLYRTHDRARRSRRCSSSSSPTRRAPARRRRCRATPSPARPARRRS